MSRYLLGLFGDLLGGHVDRHATYGEAPRAVSVAPVRGHRGVAVEDLDVVYVDAQGVGGDLGPARDVALAVGRGAGDDLDLAGGEHLDLGRLPPAAAGAQPGKHLRGAEAADLSVRRQPDAELDGISGLPPAPLFFAQALVVGELEHPVQGLLVVAGVVLDAGRGVGRLVEWFVEEIGR